MIGKRYGTKGISGEWKCECDVKVNKEQGKCGNRVRKKVNDVKQESEEEKHNGEVIKSEWRRNRVKLGVNDAR